MNTNTNLDKYADMLANAAQLRFIQGLITMDTLKEILADVYSV